jgi:hypothetical protein
MFLLLFAYISVKTYEESDRDMTHKREAETKLEASRLPRSFHLEAEPCGNGRILLVISGAKRVVSYTTEALLLDLGKAEMKVLGEALLCRSFSSGVIEIRGEVEQILFSKS